MEETQPTEIKAIPDRRAATEKDEEDRGAPVCIEELEQEGRRTVLTPLCLWEKVVDGNTAGLRHAIQKDQITPDLNGKA